MKNILHLLLNLLYFLENVLMEFRLKKIMINMVKKNILQLKMLKFFLNNVMSFSLIFWKKITFLTFLKKIKLS